MYHIWGDHSRFHVHKIFAFKFLPKLPCSCVKFTIFIITSIFTFRPNKNATESAVK